MEAGKPNIAPWVRIALLIGSCFLLASTGWLSWLRCLVTLAGPEHAQSLTLVLSYLMQAAGIAAYMAASRGIDSAARTRIALASIVGYAALVMPATLASSLATSLAFGFLANILCGVMQGHYLARLAEAIAPERRGTAFGCAYGTSTIASWLLSTVHEGVLTQDLPCLVVCALLTAASVAATVLDMRTDSEAPEDPDEHMPVNSLLILGCVTVAMASLVKGIGFGFPASDLASGVNLELTRVFYGVGLAVAGIVFDLDRRVGMALCAASLALPFLAMSLASANAPAMLLWSVEYALFGSFVVFRVTLLADLTASRGLPWAAGLGMLFGRVGDALSSWLGSSLDESSLALVAAATIAFAVSVTLMILLALRLYATEQQHDPPQRAEAELMADFCVAHSLSMRERDVLPLLLDGKTNAEIAATLFVTERTVKYHVHNIMEKTNCASRKEVADLFITSTGR